MEARMNWAHKWTQNVRVKSEPMPKLQHWVEGKQQPPSQLHPPRLPCFFSIGSTYRSQTPPKNFSLWQYPPGLERPCRVYFSFILCLLISCLIGQRFTFLKKQFFSYVSTGMKERVFCLLHNCVNTVENLGCCSEFVLCNYSMLGDSGIARQSMQWDCTTLGRLWKWDALRTFPEDWKTGDVLWFQED